MKSRAHRRGARFGIAGVVFVLALVAALWIVPAVLAMGGDGCGGA